MPRRLFGFVVLFLLIAAPLCGQQEAGAAMAAGSQSPLELRPGDVLRIAVWRQPELSGEMSVSADGYLTHPLYRSVQVTGVPLTIVEDRVRDFLTDFETNSYFVIEPMLRVAVGGEVRNPSLYTFPPSTTIAQAVALAGGPAERGRLDRVSLIRDGQEYLLDLTRYDGATSDVQIRSGDQILLARRGEPFFRAVIMPLVTFVAATASLVNIFL